MNILFLGYDRTETRIIEALEARGCKVTSRTEPINAPLACQYDLVICYGYRHVIPSHVIHPVNSAGVPIINIHIGYLPFNRGSHPSFWAAWDGTPQGVTIHLVNHGLDKGAILWRELVTSSRDDTFLVMYKVLRYRADELAIKHIEPIMLRQFGHATTQIGKGTYHAKHEMAAAQYKSDNNMMETVAGLKLLDEALSK